MPTTKVRINRDADGGVFGHGRMHVHVSMHVQGSMCKLRKHVQGTQQSQGSMCKLSKYGHQVNTRNNPMCATSLHARADWVLHRREHVQKQSWIMHVQEPATKQSKQCKLSKQSKQSKRCKQIHEQAHAPCTCRSGVASHKAQQVTQA